MNDKPNLIVDKTFDFALKTINLYVDLKKQNEYVLSKQLLRSGTSIGANVEEAVAGFSKRDFTAKMSIALKESRETRYWLRLLDKSKLVEGNFTSQINESEEIIRILTSIVKTSQERTKQS